METARIAGNLSDENQTQRLRGGVLSLGLSLTIAVAMLKLGASAPIRLVLFVPFFFSAIGLFQGLYRTCGFLAAQGMRDVGDGPEKISSRAELARVKQLGRKMFLGSTLSAAAATAVFVALP